MRALPLRPRQAGYALIELILVLGIGTFMAGAVWSVYAERRTVMRAAAHAQAVLALLDSADQVYSLSIEFATEDASGDKTSVSLDSLAASASGELPAVVGTTESGYGNVWDGFWVVTAGSSDGGTTLDMMEVQLTQVPEAECRLILPQVSPFIYDTNVNGQLVSLENAPGNTVARSTLNYAQALPLCAKVNTMTFRRLKTLDLSNLRRMKPYAGPLTPEEQGTAPSRHYRQAFLPHYTRIQNALADREAAQAALGSSP